MTLKWSAQTHLYHGSPIARNAAHRRSTSSTVAHVWDGVPSAPARSGGQNKLGVAHTQLLHRTCPPVGCVAEPVQPHHHILVSAALRVDTGMVKGHVYEV